MGECQNNNNPTITTQQADDKDSDAAPLLERDVTLYEIVVGEDSTFRTQNASLIDWERRNVIERTRGNIHTRVDLMDVTHGTYEEGGDDKATLMVFRFRFDPQKNSRRVKHARVNIEFFAANKNGTAPIVDAIAPEERWTVVPTIDQESTTRRGEINLGAQGVPFMRIGTAASIDKTVSRDISDATTITGSINLGTGKNSGESTVAVWNMQENRRRETGIPDSIKVAALLRREDSEPFNAKVTLEAEVDFVSGLQQWFAKVPLDDPILFNPQNPQKTGEKERRGRSHNGQGLSSIKLYSLCEVRMGVEASFAATGQ